MTHIYKVKSETAERQSRRRVSVAEINILRKFENDSSQVRRELIDDRIARQMGKLHAIWFAGRESQTGRERKISNE